MRGAESVEGNEGGALGGRNPFHVLELATDATPMEVERQKQKLLGMLELGLRSASAFESPLGKSSRTTDDVRSAADELAKPERRLFWELWAQPVDDESEWAEALAAHYRLLVQIQENKSIEADEFDEVGSIWDDALCSQDIYDILDEGAERLNAAEPYDVTEVFEVEVTRQLCEVLEQAAAFDLDDVNSEVAVLAVDQFILRHTDVLQLTCTTLVADSEWADGRAELWKELRRNYGGFTNGRGQYARNTAFGALAPELSDYGLELFDAANYELASSIFCFLRDEAGAVGDDETHEVQAHNVKAAESAIRERTTFDDEPLPARKKSYGGWVGAILVAVLLFGVRRCVSDDHKTTFEPEIDFSNIEIDLDKAVELDGSTP